MRRSNNTRRCASRFRRSLARSLRTLFVDFRSHFYIRLARRRPQTLRRPSSVAARSHVEPYMAANVRRVAVRPTLECPTVGHVERLQVTVRLSCNVEVSLTFAEVLFLPVGQLLRRILNFVVQFCAPNDRRREPIIYIDFAQKVEPETGRLRSGGY